MQQLLNQNSYFLVVIVVMLIAVPLTLRYAHGPWRWIVIAMVIMGLMSFAIALRTGSRALKSVEEVEAALHSGQPTVTVFYSDY